MKGTRFVILLVALLSVSVLLAQREVTRPLAPADIASIAQLVKLEDTRSYDEAALGRLPKAEHPEVRRRAAVAIGRIADKRGGLMLMTAEKDTDAEVSASVVFAVGQLKDPATVSWLGALLSAASTPPAVAREAAQALGKIRAPEARAALALYLSAAPVSVSSSPVVGEALLSIGRFMTRDDLAPIVRWTRSTDVDIRWRATWALFRPRDPSAAYPLFKLSSDPSPEVRFWAIRGLTPPALEGSSVTRDQAAARLRDALRDADRRVRTEALRALVLYDDDASFEAVMSALDSTDTWMSVSAAESLARFQSRSAVVVPRLIAAAASSKPLSLRITALAPLSTLAPDAALEVATALARESSVVARTTAVQILQRLGPAGRGRLESLAAEPGLTSLLPAPTAGRGQRAAPFPRADADYRRLAERWIVPDYSGAPKPHVILDTPRGQIEIELHPGDAPMGVDFLVSVIESGDIVGTEFGRVVPNFVAQQRAIRANGTLRDEVNRHGLLRGTLSWASAGLDTGRPGYTLGSIPQPHNEGDFTSLGRVVTGLDVIDRLELGDRITAARIKR